MQPDALPEIPAGFVNFVLVALFSLLIGLSQRRLHGAAHETDRTLGTDRTFTFLGMLGFVLYMLDPAGLRAFLAGGAFVALVLGIYYHAHVRDFRDYGATTVFIAMITYALGPVVSSQPGWMGLLLVVVVLVFSEMKESFGALSKKFGRDEFITLAKFLVIAGVILPMVPDRPIHPGLSLTPYKIWLAVVAISTISYVSYLLKKFVFRDSGIIVSAILGGLYSSTATTLIMARRSREEPESAPKYHAGIILATAMMYLRILILVLIFNTALFLILWIWILPLFLLSVAIGIVILMTGQRGTRGGGHPDGEDKNPLEFKVALIFTALYVTLTLVTGWVVGRFGTPGLNVLSFLVGLTDIDPFLISLFQGKYGIPETGIAVAALQAIISNNVMKMGYGCFFAGRSGFRYLISGFLLIIAATTLCIFLI